jgi:hypothetical protein
LYLDAIAISGDADEYSIDAALLEFTVLPGGYTTFDVIFTPNSSGTHTLKLGIVSNDPDEDPFKLDITGIGATSSEPDISIIVDSIEYVHGSTYDLGDAEYDPYGPPYDPDDYTSRIFSIKNTGTDILNVTEVTFVSQQAGDFSHDLIGSLNIPPGGIRNFTITFLPGGYFSRTTNMEISNNDADEHPYRITLNGYGRMDNDY